MFPLPKEIAVGFVVFLEIHFIILLNNRVTDFKVGLQEIIGCFTVFAFLMFLRIADDFKDYETDSILFPQRSLPSGRVKKKDLMIILTIVTVITFVLNLVFMNNRLFFLFLYFYGFLMSKWFFQKYKIQKNLPLALVTHNPVQMVINIYIISFTCIKYSLSPFTWITFLAAWTLYFPALIWEISRKIRAPKDETEYVTYSSLFGHVKATKFILILTIVDILTNVGLIMRLNIFAVFALLINVSWMTWMFTRFMKNPERFALKGKVETYTLIQESIMLLTVVVYLMIGKV